MQFQFHNVIPDKGTVIFTWDDNLASHAKIVAPLFEKFHYRCTFYINPGEAGFETLFLEQYQKLAAKGFEIGSHTDTHERLSSLTDAGFMDQIRNARDRIRDAFQIQPSTFAFPYHESDEKMLSQVRNYYFETRNSLYNSVRFSIETSVNSAQIQELIDSAVRDKYSIVFSGHGAFTENDDPKTCGYEPVPSQTLCEILRLVKDNPVLQVCTFEQAALKTYLRYHCEMGDGSVRISEGQMAFLGQYGLTKERILDLI